MSCPDLAAIARVGTPRGDRMLAEHVQSCRSCWLDWQILTGVRLLAEVHGADDPVTWGQRTGAALLVAASVVLFILAGGAL